MNINHDDELPDREVLHSEELIPPYYYRIAVFWSQGKPSASELRGTRALCQEFKDMPLRDFRRLAEADISIRLPRVYGKEDTESILMQGRSLGLQIHANATDEQS